MTRKNFESKKKNIYATDSFSVRKDADLVYVPPHQTMINFPQHPGTLRSFDFSTYYNKNCDEMVYECQKTIESLLSESVLSGGKSLTIYSITCYCRGLKVFLPFCHLITKNLQQELRLQEINKEFISQFIKYLIEHSVQKVTQKNIYSFTKSILMHLVKRGLIRNDIFPKNPFPNINRQKKGQKPLSKSEREQVVLALKKELKLLQYKEELLSSYDLSICVLTIALRTGLNPTPILELTTKCIQPHPLKKNRRLLISYKRRGRNTHLQTIRHTEDMEQLKTVMMDVYHIIDMIDKRNTKLREGSEHTNHLFLYQSSGPNRGATSLLSDNTLHKCINLFVEKNQLINSDGEQLVLNVMRLRKTFENRIWELSGQDPYVTASLAGHNVKVSNDHYLEAPAEAENNWRLMGEIRNKELLDNSNPTLLSDKENTPIAGCKDSKYGDLAPKNGSHCVNFLACFRCSSFVITEDDLYRLYSFYWLLVQERNLIGAKSWNRYYAHIIRIIDTQIIPHFDQIKVIAARKNAKENPHPFWRASEQLRLETQ